VSVVQGNLICLDDTTLRCAAPQTATMARGVVVEAGTCEADGVQGSICRLSCSAGFQISDATDGRCILHDELGMAVYEGQAVTCEPQQNADGAMSESYCRLEESEIVRTCCVAADLERKSDPTFATTVDVSCGTSHPPHTCDAACAGIWLPLVEDCEQY
jgi:hypothetical protein